MMIHLAPHCTPPTKETFDRALRHFLHRHPQDRKKDRDSIENITSIFFASSVGLKEDPSAQKFVRERIVIIPSRSKNPTVIFQGNCIAEGNFKLIYEGLFPTSNKVLQVAIVRTKAKEKKPGTDWNQNEYEFLQEMIRKPIPGCIEVLLVGISKPKDVTLFPQFMFILNLSHCDLYHITEKYHSQLTSLQTAETQSIPKEINPNLAYQIREIQCAVMQLFSQIHRRGFFHGDIKPENILCQILHKRAKRIAQLPSMSLLNLPETEIELRACDFSFSGRQEDPKIQRTTAATPTYMSPEAANWRINPQVQCPPLSGKMETWSIGLILLALEDPKLFSMIVPFNQIPKNASAKDILKICAEKYASYFQRKTIPEFPEPAKNTMKHLIWKMLRPRPEERISLFDALQEFKQIKPLPSPPRQPPGDPLEEIAQLYL